MRKVEGGSWVQVDGKLVPKAEYRREGPTAAYVMGDIETFISPIDGSEITDRSKLRKHMREHEVTDARDYSDAWYEKKGKARDAILRSDSEACKRERRETINDAINRFT